MDGVDAALIDTTTNQCIYGLTRPYGAEAQKFLEEVLSSKFIGLSTLNQLNTLLGREFAASVLLLLEKSNYLAKDVVAIGSHGQTIAHDASADIPYTIQLACAHTIAQLTGIKVVADFRTRDLVVGGQGAPFAPLYHQVLFANRKAPIAVVNIGGISNVTFLDDSNTILGYDIGPGNCLMDAWINKVLNKSFDHEGAWGGSGHVVQSLLLECLSDPYFKRPYPKSIGKEYFSLNWLLPKLNNGYRPEDIQATMLELTAMTISSAIKEHGESVSGVVICGGGVHNKALLRALQQNINEIPVISSTAFGVNPDYIEAMLFAWLAEKTIQNIPLDLRTLTGSNQPVVLGAIYPA